MVCWLKLIGKTWGLSELRLNLNKKKVSYFSGISKVLGLCLPIIYNRMKGEQYDILIFTYRCLLGWFSWGRSFTIKF